MQLRSRMVQAAAMVLLLVAVVAMLQTSLTAQTTGTISGTVLDATGAVIPNAVVVLTNQLNGTTRQTTTGGSGYFALPSVLPSTSYVITVTATGFQTWQSQPFPLRPGDTRGLNDIQLAVATASQEITIEATGESVKPLTSGERSDVITANEIKTLAVVGRDATELIRMLPGFTMSSGDQGVNNKPGYNTAVVGLSGPSGSFSANGTGTTGISVVSDGATLNDILSGSGTTQNVNIDMVEEVKVSTSSYGAENAKGPTVINVVGKAGSSAFHGMGYFYARDTSLNANDWYDNHLQQSRPDGRYLYPGGQLGGPVILPFTGFNRDRKKMFFFFGYEYYNQHFGSGTLGSWVPTLAMRQGDFSQASLNAQLCGLRPDGLPNPNALQQMCMTENFLGDGTPVINGDVRQYANQSGVALVNWLPLPNANPFTNASGYNYIQQVLQQQNGSQLRGRIDYSFNDNNKLFASYNRQWQIGEVPVNWGGYNPPYAAIYPADVTSGDLSNVLSVNYTRVFSPRMTNELSASMAFVSQPGRMDTPEAASRFSMNDYNCLDPAKRDSGTCGSLGYGNFNYLGQFKNAGDYSVPALTNWGGGLGYPQMLMPGGFYNNQVRMKKIVSNLSDFVSVLSGRHLLKAGFFFERGILNGLADNNAYPQGQLSFDNNHTRWSQYVNGAAGWVGCHSSDPEGQQRLGGAAYLGNCVNPIAMMYMGYASNYQQANFSPVVNMQYNTISGFISDTWTLNRRLTLNLGARFEHMGPWNDRKGNGVAVFDPTLYASQCTGVGRDCPNNLLPGVTWHSADSSVPLSGVKLASLYFSPRMGAALDVFGNGSTVIRGGGGVYRSQEEFQPYALATSSATGYKNSYLNDGSRVLSFDTIDSHSPGGADVADFNIDVIDRNDTKRPLFWEYNLTIDQQLPWHSHIEVGYVGSRASNLSSGHTSYSDLNLMPVGTLLDENLNLSAIPDSVTGGTVAGDIGSLSTAEIDYFRKYPFYQHIFQIRHDFYSKYDSLQVSWNRTRGTVTFGANYTFSKNLAVAPSWGSNLSSSGTTLPDPVNLANDYGPLPFDRTHVLNVHYLVDFGSRFHGNKWLGYLLNGWQLSGISTLQSGPPLTSVQGLNLGFNWSEIVPTPVWSTNQFNKGLLQTCTNAGISGGCINQISNSIWLGTPDVMLMPTVVCDPTSNVGTNQFINVECFGVPNPKENGANRLPYIHGPAYMNHDISAMKNFKLGEKRNLQLRLAAFNFLNHPLVSFNKNDTNALNLGNFQNAVPGQALSNTYMNYQSFGIANVKYGSRLMELSVKFEF